METVDDDELLAGRWRIGAVIGRGAAADIHAATGPDGRRVAVKIIRTVEDDGVRRFERELAALEGVDHPGIVAVHGHGRCPDGRPFAVLDRIDGETLEASLRDGPLGPIAAAALGSRIADALAHAHQRGVIHRDVKPSNILLDDGGRPVLVDFGIARLADSPELTATGWTLGTPAYLAPEQVRGDDVGPSADIYSLGLVVLEAATGARAFPGEGIAVALARLDAPVAVAEDLPPRLAAALRAMTGLEPDRRPTATDAAEWLAAVMDAGSTIVFPAAATATAALPVVSEPGVRRARSHRASPIPLWALITVIALALVLAVGVATANRGGSAAPPATTTTSTSTTVATTPSTLPPPAVTVAEPDGRPGRGNGNDHGHGHGNGNDEG